MSFEIVYELINQYIIQDPSAVSLGFFGPLLGLIGSLAGLAGGGGQDNSASVKASVQNQKLKSATDSATNAAQIAQRAAEQQQISERQIAQLQQQPLAQIVSGFRSALLRNLDGR